LDKSDVITLLSADKVQDENGVWRDVVQYLTTDTGKNIITEEGKKILILDGITVRVKTVFCNVNSVSRNEFFEAGRNGLNPEFVFTMFFGDYEGEHTLIYNGLAYAVYRTYRGRNDTIELYVERKGGTNGKQSYS
jgi:SPP1 family predicted phage head-tail adaptor